MRNSPRPAGPPPGPEAWGDGRTDTVKLKPGVCYRDLWAAAEEAPAADPPESTETTIADWRAFFIAVLDALKDFPEARKAADAAIFRVGEERQRRR